MGNYGRKGFTEAEIVNALDMVKKGFSYSLIAEKIGCNKSLIGKWVKKSGIKPNTKIKKVSNRKSKIYQNWNTITENIDVLDKYQELIMAVGNKYPNETRHETALRYIKNAELLEK